MSIFKCRFHGKIFKWIAYMVECSIYLLFSFVLLFFDVVQDEMLLMVMVHKANRIDGQSVRFTFNLLSKDQHAESASTEWGQRVSKCAKGIEATLPFFPSFIAYRATDEIRSIHRSNHRSNDRSINRSINRWVFFSAAAQYLWQVHK